MFLRSGSNRFFPQLFFDMSKRSAEDPLLPERPAVQTICVFCFAFKMAKQFVSQVYKCLGLWRPTRPRTEISKVLFKCEWVLHDGVLHWKYTYVNGKTKMKLGCVEATAVFIVIGFWFCL